MSYKLVMIITIGNMTLGVGMYMRSCTVLSSHRARRRRGVQASWLFWCLTYLEVGYWSDKPRLCRLGYSSLPMGRGSRQINMQKTDPQSLWSVESERVRRNVEWRRKVLLFTRRRCLLNRWKFGRDLLGYFWSEKSSIEGGIGRRSSSSIATVEIGKITSTVVA